MPTRKAELAARGCMKPICPLACKAAVKTVNNNIYQVVKAASPAPVAQAFKKLQDETNNGLKQIDKNIFQPIGAEIERNPGNAKKLPPVQAKAREQTFIVRLHGVVPL